MLAYINYGKPFIFREKLKKKENERKEERRKMKPSSSCDLLKYVSRNALMYNKYFNR